MAESLKPATTKNLSQGLATTLSGALKYQWTKFTLGTLYRNAPDRILGVKLPKALNEATAGAALKYHIKRALERSHTISDFTKQLDLSAKNSQFSNNTLKIIEELNNAVLQASEELSKKASDLAHAITPLKEFGKNYPEFALKPKEALEKLLQEKNGQVAGTAYREDLGGIDFVWGNKDYGLEHILQRREGQAIDKGLNEAEAKEYALNLVKSIPEIIEKGVKVDNNGRIAIEHQNIRVGLKDNWKGEKLPNHWVITSYEKRLEDSESLYSSPLITKSEHLLLNSNEPNPTTSTLKNQEPKSPLELAKAEKLAKLESEKRIKEVSKKSAEKTENQITLKQRLTRRTLSTLSFRRQERLKNKPMEWACI
ncbi:DUF3519 domain-containing protein [Helicobacter pylori]|nr:DUF3519 domain-containing protein [Helicobacter pylori]